MRWVRRVAIGMGLLAIAYPVRPISLRAHGDSEGSRNDMGWSARLDIQAAVLHAPTVRSDLPAFVYGSSLGAGAALFAAESTGSRVDGYILVAAIFGVRFAAGPDATCRRAWTRSPTGPCCWVATGSCRMTTASDPWTPPNGSRPMFIDLGRRGRRSRAPIGCPRNRAKSAARGGSRGARNEP